MDSQLTGDAKRQLDRFCRQYLQLYLEPEYPDSSHLQSDVFQGLLYTALFKENSIKYAPPLRYQLKVLKELTRRIEKSIQDWDEQVGIVSRTFHNVSDSLNIDLHL